MESISVMVSVVTQCAASCSNSTKGATSLFRSAVDCGSAMISAAAQCSPFWSNSEHRWPSLVLRTCSHHRGGLRVAELGPVVRTHVVGDSVDAEQVDELYCVGSTQGHQSDMSGINVCHCQEVVVSTRRARCCGDGQLVGPAGLCVQDVGHLWC